MLPACSGRLPRHPAVREAGATVRRLHTRMPSQAVLRSFLAPPGARWSWREQRARGRLSDPGQVRRGTLSIGCSYRRRPPPARRRGRAVRERAEAAGSSGGSGLAHCQFRSRGNLALRQRLAAVGHARGESGGTMGPNTPGQTLPGSRLLAVMPSAASARAHLGAAVDAAPGRCMGSGTLAGPGRWPVTSLSWRSRRALLLRRGPAVPVGPPFMTSFARAIGKGAGSGPG